MKIAISSDSTCSISQVQAQELGIYILPLNVIVDGEEYHDDITINQEKLNTMMRTGSKIQTSTPTPYEIETYFNKIFSEGYDKIIHFTISSKLSSMYSLFTITCKEKYGDKIEVIDSLSVCSFMGNLVRRAKRLNDEGKEINDIVNEVKTYINKDEIYFVPESLTFLKNGGRVSPAVALIGNMLGIKPFLKFGDGEISKHGTVRTYKKAFNEMIEIYKQNNLDPNVDEFHVIYFDASDAAADVQKMVATAFPDFNIVCTPISINVCAHCGPGTIGLGCCKKW
jgi:DegV family protein with EDD domain